MSDRKAITNRENAQRSTGPRTSVGKKKASLNAFRHGLAMPLRGNSVLSAEVERLVRIILTDAVFEVRRADALVIAESQVDIARVRAAKLPLIEKLCSPLGAILEEESDQLGSETIVPRLAIRDLYREIERLDRYERRAFARLMKTIHDLAIRKTATGLSQNESKRAEQP